MQNYIGKQIDRYRITERLGMGGMAVVYKAFDTRLERDVALKLIRTDEIPQSQYEKLMKRFEREAKAQARFDHKHIVTVHDYGELDGAPYLVMSYISGGTLKARTGKPVDWQQAVRWLLPLTDALAYAHEAGVIHRDIKPSNILFDAKDQPILTDFGIAKILETDEATLTGTGLGVGTPEYMAPEQWQGHAMPATDQYALGVVLYELLTGQKPFTADTPAAIILKQATESLRSPRDLVTGIPEGLEKLIYKALARDAQDRYEDMEAFRAALERQLIDQPVQAQDMDPFPSPDRAAVTAEPFPQPRSEAETVDELVPTPNEVAPMPVEKVSVTFKTQQEKPHEMAKTGQPSQRSVKSKARLPRWSLWAGGAVLIVALMVGGISLLAPGRRDNMPGAEPTEAAVAQVDTSIPTATETPLPAQTATKTSIATRTPTITPTTEPTLGIGSTMVNPVDGAVLVYVPEGEFLMGSDEEDARENEKPQRLVYLDAFWIYQHPVTNAEYRMCVDESVCNKPAIEFHFNSLDFSEHPVRYISWFDASAYCEWAEGRLPTEAEWEKTARGTDGRKFPWGDNQATCNLANYKFCYPSEETFPVGSFPDGASPYGALDMAGNVWEWVADWYGEDYYSRSPAENPTGPTSGTRRVIRGGAWESFERDMRVSRRAGWFFPDKAYFSLGFRCLHIEKP